MWIVDLDFINFKTNKKCRFCLQKLEKKSGLYQLQIY